MEMRRRIGMLTFHQCHNYGAMLCAYALQQCILLMGYEVECIDIENDIFDEYGKKAGHQLYRRKDKAASVYRERYREDLDKLWDGFEIFKERYIYCSKTVDSEEQVEKTIGEYDILLVGGDQLWNENLPVSLDIFVLPFETSIRKITFGTSMGSAENMSVRRRMYLKKFTAIGVRETYASEFIKKYTGISAAVTVDPVFLLEKKQWLQLCRPIQEDNYIFVYLFNKKEQDFLVRIHQLRKLAEKNRGVL